MCSDFFQAKYVPKPFSSGGQSPGPNDAPHGALIGSKGDPTIPISLLFDAFGVSSGGPVSTAGPGPPNGVNKTALLYGYTLLGRVTLLL